MAELEGFFFVPGLENIQVEAEMLDYDYIAKCDDWQKLLKIVEVLKSGKEGNYPDLLKASESRMIDIMPTKEKKRYLAMFVPVSPIEISEAEQDILKWSSNVSKVDCNLSKKKNGEDNIFSETPTSTLLNLNQNEKISKLLKVSPHLSILTKNQLLKILSASETLKVDSLSDLIRERKSDIEKNKGNECFKASEFDTAITHYTNSIALFGQNDVIWSNRAIAYIKKELYDLSEMDCNIALILNPTSVKALSRRGLSRFSQGKYKDAVFDYVEALKFDPKNVEFQKLLDKALAKYEETEGKPLDLHNQTKSVVIDLASEIDLVSKFLGTDEFVAINSVKVDSFMDLVISEANIVEHYKGCVSLSDGKEPINSGTTETFVQIPISFDEDSGDEQDIPINSTSENSPSEFVRVVIEEDEEDEEENIADGKSNDESNKESTHVIDQKQNEAKSIELKESGNQLLLKGDLQGALNYYNESLNLYFSHLTLNNRAQAKLSLKDFQGAIDDCTAVLKFDPLNVKALLRRSKANFELLRYKDSIADVLKILEIEPVNKTALSFKVELENYIQSDEFKVYGNKAMETADFIRAIELYSTSIEKNNMNIASYNNRSQAYIGLQKFELAKKDATFVIENASQLSSIGSSQILNLTNKAYYRRALASFNLAVNNSNLDLKVIELFDSSRDLEKLLENDSENKAALELKLKIQNLSVEIEAEKEERIKAIEAEEIKKQKALLAKLESEKTVVESKENVKSPIKKLTPVKKVDISIKLEVPSTAPKTLYEFERVWRGLNSDPQLRVQYLETFKKSTFKKIFKEAVSGDLLGSIFQSLNSANISAKVMLKILSGLSEMNSFDLTISLLPKEDIEQLKQVFEKLQNHKDSIDEINDLKSLYKL